MQIEHLLFLPVLGLYALLGVGVWKMIRHVHRKARQRALTRRNDWESK